MSKNNRFSALCIDEHYEYNKCNKDITNIIDVNNSEKNDKTIISKNSTDSSNNDGWKNVSFLKHKKEQKRSMNIPITTTHQKSDNVPYNSNSNPNLIKPNKNIQVDKIRTINTPRFTKLDSLQQIKSVQTNNSSSLKKSFTAKPVEKKGSIILPDYYGVRSNDNPYEIYQSEYDWIRRVGGLEKSETIDHMFKGAMTCAISYFDNYMVKNKFFTNKISTDESKQDELIELICIQTTAILFHRLIKSDSSEIVKTILKNLPLYRTVSGNPSERSNSERTSSGSLAYMRVRRRFIDNLRTSKNNNSITKEDKIAATTKVFDIEHKWSRYILQSIWNGNNPIHDCLYYGAKSSFEFLLCHYFEHGIHKELNHMMLVANIQNETHDTILENGIKACDSQGSLNIIRKKQYNECGHLYNNTVKTLYAQINNLIKEESTNVVSNRTVNNIFNKVDILDPIKSNSTLNKQEINKLELSDDSEGDNVNICSLISNGDVDGMVNHIERCAKKDQFDIISKTFDLWEAASNADSTGQLKDYICDVKFLCKDILNTVN
jgi:hypothetical protein